jgi:parvulin-like peptidyl-prolyl isomerase
MLLAALGSLVCAAGGCQAKERQPDSAPNPDFASLLNLPGCQPALAARSQKPAPRPSPLELGDDAPGNKAARSARIRAVVNGEAILDEEVQAAAIQVLMTARSDAEKADILNKKLTEIIERELLLQDAAARLKKRSGFMDELKTIADREFDKQWLQRLMRANKYTDAEAFKRFLEDQGMPFKMIRRQWVRNFIAMEYIRSRIEPSISRIGHLEIVEYYNKNASEFQVEDGVQWQDIFIAHARHGGSVEASRRFAESLVLRIRKGEDFVRLAKEFDNGESSLRENSLGIGQKRGEIRPIEAEPILFSLKEKEVGPLIENEAGFHIVRLVSRTYAGRKPFDEKVQKEVKEKLRGKVFEAEMKRIISDLKARAIIEVANEIK